MSSRTETFSGVWMLANGSFWNGFGRVFAAVRHSLAAAAELRQATLLIQKCFVRNADVRASDRM
ncbi:MAG TPA: hypothetical protein VMB73_12605 [Acetobacteraceae bacterium]|jgi:hypothetical protein|nr:hypothetical protein [Acetobacteraceae bacterium]